MAIFIPRREIMKSLRILLALIFSTFSLAAYAEPKIEVLHWWTSGGEAKALQVLKDEFAAKGGVWEDMPVAGGGGDAANQTLKARIVAGDPPSASQIKGPTIQEYDQAGVVAPYNIDSVAQSEGWDSLLSPAVAAVHKCENNSGAYCAAPVNIHRIDWFWANKQVLDANGISMPSTWDEFNAAADKLQAAGIIPFAHGGQPWQDATVFEAVALSFGNNFYKNAIVNLDDNALRSETMVKVFDQMRKLANYTDEGSPGRDWNVATAMVMEGKAAFQLMGDWAKGEFAAAGKVPGVDYYCASTPSNDGYIYNVDSFIFYKTSDPDKVEGQQILASLMMGKNFQKVFNLYKGSIPARLDVPMDEFDDCAKKSNSDLNTANSTGGLVPSFAHGMAQGNTIKGAMQDVITQHFNSDMSSVDAANALADAVAANM
jgi:glucose/mannose transport system substrate-binding protein